MINPRSNENRVGDRPREHALEDRVTHTGKRVETELDELTNSSVRDNDEERTELVRHLLSTQSYQKIGCFRDGEGVD